ncbi:MAG: hypothetical protein K5770_14705 [Lachnospiraceae bacterium]|nr:hypothetical protein [Lachnospiraceae bacterium]
MAKGVGTDMKLTRITTENSAFFTGLCPEEMLSDRRTVKLGALPEENLNYFIAWTNVPDEADPLGREGQKIVREQAGLDEPIRLTSCSEAEQFMLKRELGAGKTEVAQSYRKELGDRLIGEYMEKRKDKAYLDRMQKVIDDYRKQIKLVNKAG